MQEVYGQSSSRLRCFFLAVLLVLPRCVIVSKSLFERAAANRQHVAQLQIGQSTDEVRSIMGPPERRNARLRYDGKTVEEWSYFTDAALKRDTTLTFLDGKVVEIRTTPSSEPD